MLHKIFRPARRVSGYKSHRLYYGHVVDSQGETADEVIVGVMLSPRSYTTEDTVEINCHGGAACTRAVLREVLAAGARLAQPGEFTKRAFLNGRIDLSQAESVIELINAGTDMARRAALRGVGGALKNAVTECRDEVLTILAHIEVSIDYPGELETMSLPEVAERLGAVCGKLDRVMRNAGQGALLRDGLSAVLLGRPNVGKSSLMNALLDEERAIVTDIPGTTRDILRERISLDGVPLQITDTAGIRDTDEAIEMAGVEKARTAAESADLALMVLDGSQPFCAGDMELIEGYRHKKMVVVVNKADLAGPEPEAGTSDLKGLRSAWPVVRVSALKGTGIELLREKIIELLGLGEVAANNEAVICSERNMDALARARAAFMRSQAVAENMPEDIVAIDLAEGLECLGEITGETLAEDLEEKIFAEFCVGK
jgi:tRNA modification GTPase